SMLRQAGAIETDSYTELMDILQVLACQPVPRGPRLSVIGNAPAVNRLTVENARSTGHEVVDVQDIRTLDAALIGQQNTQYVTESIRNTIDAVQADAIIVLIQPGLHQDKGDATQLALAIQDAAGDSEITIMASFTAVLEEAFSPTSIIGRGELRFSDGEESYDQKTNRPQK